MPWMPGKLRAIFALSQSARVGSARDRKRVGSGGMVRVLLSFVLRWSVRCDSSFPEVVDLQFDVSEPVILGLSALRGIKPR